jgi:hypothetical protein
MKILFPLGFQVQKSNGQTASLQPLWPFYIDCYGKIFLEWLFLNSPIPLILLLIHLYKSLFLWAARWRLKCERRVLTPAHLSSQLTWPFLWEPSSSSSALFPVLKNVCHIQDGKTQLCSLLLVQAPV